MIEVTFVLVLSSQASLSEKYSYLSLSTREDLQGLSPSLLPASVCSVQSQVKRILLPEYGQSEFIVLLDKDLVGLIPQ